MRPLISRTKDAKWSDRQEQKGKNTLLQGMTGKKRWRKRFAVNTECYEQENYVRKLSLQI